MVGREVKSASSECAGFGKLGFIEKNLLKLRRCEGYEIEMPTIDESESLSDIDDKELSGYLNSTEVVNYKKTIWEELYKEQAKVKRAKRAVEDKKANRLKKADPVKKVPKVTDKTDSEKTRSSKINYDALDKLNAELECFGDANNEITSPSSSHGNL